MTFLEYSQKRNVDITTQFRHEDNAYAFRFRYPDNWVQVTMIPLFDIREGMEPLIVDLMEKEYLDYLELKGMDIKIIKPTFKDQLDINQFLGGIKK